MIIKNNILDKKLVIKSESYLNFYKNLPVLITGGVGFIGSYLTRKLIDIGANVTILDDLSQSNLSSLKPIINKITFIKGSITDFQTCFLASKDKKIIFHLAAKTSVWESLKNPIDLYNINVNGTLNLLESGRINQIQTFVFASSAAVYGESKYPCKEDQLCNPKSSYGYSKYFSELICKQYSYEIDSIILRYFNVFDTYQDKKNKTHLATVIPQFRYKMQNNLPITIFGDGSQTRDFVPIDYVIESTLLLATLKQKKYEIFNIATGESIPLLELINILKKEFPNYNQNIIFEPMRLEDIKNSQADNSKLYNIVSNFKEF